MEEKSIQFDLGKRFWAPILCLAFLLIVLTPLSTAAGTNGMDTSQSGWLSILFYLHPVKTVFMTTLVLVAFILVLIILLHVRQKNANVMHKALYTDALTGYHNYSALVREAPHLFQKIPGHYALAYLDIHQFKVINDTFGYENGDRVLIATAELLHSFITEDERFARLYADTFVLLIHYGDEKMLRSRLDELIQRLDRLPLDDLGTISPLFLGGVYRLPNGMDNLDQACDRANYAKGSIKNHFTNTFVFYDDVMRRRVLAEKELERSMQPALEREEFIPYYQPKINAITGKVMGTEALVRWNHPTKGLLSPAVFLPFYEQNGFITKIDLLIFTQVCRDLGQWLKTDHEAVPVSVNFSRHHVRDKTLPGRLWEIARQHHVPPHLIEVEITETQELENMDTAVEFVNGLKSYGFGVSIDDYGTGYSSISFLQQLPLDSLKLDRAFILNAMESDKARDIMSHLVAAMHQNRIRVVCEGVETQTQLDFAVSLNCRFIQGYFYSTPLPRTDFEAYLLKHGIEASEDKVFLPITHFNGENWSGAEDFLSQYMPSWFFCCLVKPGSPVLFISPNFLAAIGYSALEFEAETGNIYANLIHPDDLPQTMECLNQRSPRDREILLQYRLRKRDGSYLWIREVNRIVLSDDGREALLCVCTDISDLVSLQEEQCRLISTVPGGVGELLLTEEGPVIQQANDHFYSVLGFTQEEMKDLGNNISQILYQPDRLDVMERMQALLTGHTSSCTCTFRVCCPNGVLHWVSFLGATFPTEAGLCVTVIAYSSDEEMREKQTAEVSKAKLELTLTLANHAVFEYDVQSKIIDSHSGLSLYGLPDEIPLDIEKCLIQSQFVHPDDAKKLSETHRKTSAGETHTSCEIRIRGNYDQPDSPYQWVRVTLSTIFSGDKRPIRAVGIVENINQRKHFEYALREESQFRKAFTESSLMALEINLTQDSIQRITGSRSFRIHAFQQSLSQPNNYSLLTSAVLPILVAPEDQESYARQFSRTYLLDLFESGIDQLEVEYRRITPEGEERWNAALIYLLMDQFSGDIMGYVYHRDIHERKSTEYGLMKQVSRDSLTGVFNRAAAERLIENYLSHHTDSNRIHAFLMLDFDQFKELNDTYGHPMGDKCLIELAKVLQEHLRADDMIARMGGDEFAILLKNLPNAQSARSIAEKLSNAIEDIAIRLGLALRTSASIGIALTPIHGMDFETLYSHADTALYQVKRGSEGQISVFELEYAENEGPGRPSS